MINLAKEEYEHRIALIKVLGVGGGGGNTINSIIESGYTGIDFIAANTDAQALSLSKAHVKIQIGVKATKGLGTGANPDLGKRSAEEDMDKILAAIGDADIVFLIAGLGGGTGSGAVPSIAHALKERGVLCIVIVTKPFLFEGKKRMAVAQQALELIKKEADTVIVIPNQKLLDVVDQHVPMIDAFALINEVSCLSVKGIADIITQPGHINVDFADVRTVMKDRGLALMATARAKGENRAEDAALNAITSPLLEDMCIQGARGVLLNITGDSSLTLHEVAKAASIVYEQADEDAYIIIGSVIDENMNNEVSVTVIATGFEQEAPSVKTEAPRTQEKDITYHKAMVKKDESFYDYNTLQSTISSQSDVNAMDLNTLDIPAILRHHHNKVKEDN